MIFFFSFFFFKNRRNLIFAAVHIKSKNPKEYSKVCSLNSNLALTIENPSDPL